MQELIDYLEKHAALFTAIGALVAIVVTVIGFVIRMRRKAFVFETLIDDLHKRLDGKTIEAATLAEKNGALERQRDAVREERDSVEAKLADFRAEQETVRVQLNEKIETLQDDIETRDAAIRRQQSLVSKMMKLEGQLWERRANAGTPRFRPLTDRQTAVVSVLNLKGGVGKTTVTAHLGAAFAARGYRVLLVDLDLQGTLSSFFIPHSDIVAKYRDEKLLQHFLGQATHRRKMNLLEYVEPILDDAECGIVPTSDKLAYAEMNLTMSWLLKLGKKDTRFLLRRALHQKRITNRYDLVLMDCPPLINTCCVNALAASDYVLIPVNPSKKVTERVPQLLRHVKKLGEHINPHLQVAGVVMNRTHSADKLTVQEGEMWGQLLVQGQDQLGIPLHGFKANIPQTKEIRVSEAETFQPPEKGSELHKAFGRLAAELEERLPRECRRVEAAR